MPTIKTVMTAFPYSVDAGADIPQAQAFLREHRIRHLPVTEHGQLTGILSDRDIKLVLGPDFAYPSPRELKVRDVMVKHPYIVDLETRLDEVLIHMADEQLGSAIVTREGKLAGIFTVTDACRGYAELLREQFRRAGGGGDAA